MKFKLTTILEKLSPILTFARRNASFIFIVIFLGIYIYLVEHIGYLIKNEPTQAQIETKLKPVNKLKVDQEAVQQITELESQNIEVKSLFDQARQNPFTE